MKGVDKIYVVNLEKDKERLEAFYKKSPFKKDEVSVLKAINGYKIEMNDFIKNLFEGNDFNYRCGVTGCALSHYYLWKKLAKELDEEMSLAMIFEDDVNFYEQHDFLDIWNNKVFPTLPNFFDLIYLGGCHHDDTYKRTKNHKNMNVGPNLCYPFRNIGFGTYSYLMSKKGAKKMVEIADQWKIKRGIDHVLRNAEMKGMVIHATVPLLCWSPAAHPDSNVHANMKTLMDNTK